MNPGHKLLDESRVSYFFTPTPTIVVKESKFGPVK